MLNAHPLAQSAMDIANGKDHFLPIQALLYQMVDDYWRGEDYILGYIPRLKRRYDVGLNHLVGSKWPTKAWPMSHWKELEKLCLKEGLSVKWQEGKDNIEEYMDWIFAGRLIVTCDSLGMHLGLALRKKVIALFGSTPSDGIYMYNRGTIVRAQGSCAKAPCMKSCCDNDMVCMKEIAPEHVMRLIIILLGLTNPVAKNPRVARASKGKGEMLSPAPMAK
jgi:heptosyltransferase-2